MIKLCIFDLDGTLLNTIDTISYYGNNALKLCGIEPIAADDYKYLVGTGIINLIKNMLNFRNCYSDEMFKKVFKAYDDAYNRDTMYLTRPYDGIIETLNKIKSSGIKIAIVSNKPHFAAQSVVAQIFGENFFDCVIGQRENVAIKPDPVSVLEIIDKYNSDKDECIYLGDTSVDMKTGKSAGLFTIGVLWGFRDEKELKDNGADLIIENPSEIYDYILNFNK